MKWARGIKSAFALDGAGIAALQPLHRLLTPVAIFYLFHIKVVRKWGTFKNFD